MWGCGEHFQVGGGEKHGEVCKAEELMGDQPGWRAAGGEVGCLEDPAGPVKRFGLYLRDKLSHHRVLGKDVT